MKKLSKELLVLAGLIAAFMISENLLGRVLIHFSLISTATNQFDIHWDNLWLHSCWATVGLISTVCYAAWLLKLSPWKTLQFLGVKAFNYKQVLVGISAALPIVAVHWISIRFYSQPGVGLRSNWGPYLVYTVIGAGFFEELTFRGMFFQYFRKNHSFLVAATLSGVFWSLMHLYMSPQLGAIWVSMVLAFILAFPAAYLFEKGEMVVWGWMIVHLSVDSAQLFINPNGTSFSDQWILSLVALIVSVIITFPLSNWILKPL
jgi:membrane protease YdiL (CAAX protease family)